MSRPASSSDEMGGLSGFRTGAVCPSAGAGPVRSGVASFWAAAHTLIPRNATSNRIVRAVAIVSTVNLLSDNVILRNNNRISRLQNVVLFHLLALDQLAIVHRKLLLLAVLHTHYIDLLGIGELRHSGARQRLQNSHVRQHWQRPGVPHLTNHKNPLAVDRRYDHSYTRAGDVLLEFFCQRIG